MTIIRSWDVDTLGTDDSRMWYKRSTYRLFHNLVHSFKQPKLTRILLAKWRASSADKRPNLNHTSGTSSTREVWNKYSSDEDEDDCDDLVAIFEIFRDKFGSTKQKLSRSEQLQEKVDAYLGNQCRFLNELTSSITVDSEGKEEKCPTEALESCKRPYTVMSVDDCSKILSKIRKGGDIDEVIEDDEFHDDGDDYQLGNAYQTQEDE